jgi:hypothetical protein
MRGIRLGIYLVLAAALALLVYAFLSKEARPVPENDREIAWIHAATSGLLWERFVGGIQRFEESPEGRALGLRVDYDRAYLDQTAAVPDVVLSRAGSSQRLHIRWYKLTSSTDIAYWARVLSRRTPPPLAIIGGGSSDRARDLARELHLAERERGELTPLLLITTATADRVYLGDEHVEGHELTRIYADRSFRCCFTNSQMAEALTAFLLSQPELRPHGPESLAVGGIGQALGGRGLAAAANFVMGLPAPVFTIEWEDDPYSLDLAEHFRAELRQRLPSRIVNQRVPYSTGDYFRPNTPESAAVSELARELTAYPEQRPLLVLPAGDKPVRRFLRALAVEAPIEVRNSVAVTGDSINLDVIFRDRATSWNVQELPLPLVLFAHEDPVDWKPEWKEGGGQAWKGCSATHDLLLNAKIARLLVEAAWHNDGEGRLILAATPEELRTRLIALDPAFFDASGNRLRASGAYVVWLQPQFSQNRVLSRGVISVWSGRAAESPQGRQWHWQRLKQWTVEYGSTAAPSS